MKKTLKILLLIIVGFVTINIAYTIGCVQEAKQFNVVIEGWTGDRVDGVGSGVIISNDGLILTAGHCVDGVTKIRVTLPDGTKYIVTDFYKDPNSDVGLLRIPTITSCAKFSDSNDLDKYDIVYNIGNGRGIWDSSVYFGTVYTNHFVRNVVGTEEFILLRMNAYPGCSGGGVYQYNHLIGILVRGGNGAIFVVPSNVIKQIVERNPLIPTPLEREAKEINKWLTEM